MADYKAIKGHNIETVAGDPSVLQVGDIWYSNTTRKIRGAKLGAGAWSSGTAMGTARYFNAAAGTQTSGLVAAGYSNQTAAVTLNSEEWNGSAWAEGNNINTSGVYLYNSFGTQTAAVVAGRSEPAPTVCEEYNGTSWTEVTGTDTGRYQSGGSGTLTAGLVWGGAPALQLVETYDGTNWTEVNDLNTGRQNVSGCGTQTATLCIAGYPAKALVEEYNGTSWTEIADLNVNTYGTGSFGDTANAVICGNSPASTKTEQWNGTSWTEVNDMSTPRAQSNSHGGTYAAGMVVGGGPPSITTVEEWDISAAASSFTSS